MVYRRTLGVALVSLLTLAGCASNAQRASDQKEMTASVPVCETDRQCKAEWDAATTWVASNCGMKIQTATDTIIQTANPVPYSPLTACTVNKIPGPGHKFALTIRVGCDNIFGCQPSSKSQVLAFGDYVRQAGLPFQPLKIGAKLVAIDSKGAPTTIMAEAVGMRVDAIQPGSRASAAGLVMGDVITSINGRRMRNEDDWADFIGTVAPGDTLSVGVRRSGQDLAVSMPL